MRVVIDTNCLLASISRDSRSHALYLEFVAEKFTWILSNEILNEYHEVIGKFYTHATAEVVVNRLMASENVEMREPFFRWNLVVEDPDDNKFVDLFIAANAHLIITNDKHILKLNALPFPPVIAVTLEEFLKKIST